MRRLIAVVMCAAFVGCASNPTVSGLDCENHGSCQARLEQVGYNWYVKADTECGIVEMEGEENAEKKISILPFCGHERRLPQQSSYGILSCQACARR